MSWLTRRALLNTLHLLEERAVVIGAITSGMDAPMTVGAERDDVSGIVRPAIGKAADVMGLKVGNAVRPGKGRVILTALAFAQRSSNNIVSHIPTSFEDASGHLALGWFLHRCRERAVSQVIERPCCLRRSYRHALNVLEYRFNWTKDEHDGVADISKPVRSADNLVVLVDHLTVETQTGLQFCEEQEAFPAHGVARNAQVTFIHLHVANLAFAEVFETPVDGPVVVITVFEAFVAGDYYDQVVLRRRDDAALLLSSEGRMDAGSPVVDAAFFKSPRHLHPQCSLLRLSVTARSWAYQVKETPIANAA